MRVVSKGNYAHRQLSSFLSVKQFLIGNEGNDRFLLLRFVNGGKEVITSFRMEIYRLTEDGNVIGSNEYVYHGPPVQPGEEFGPYEKIPIESFCADVRVEIRSVRAHDYVYEVGKRGIRVRYAPEEEPDREALIRRTGGKRCVAVSGTKRLTVILLAVTFALCAAIGTLSVFRFLGMREEEEEAAESAATVEVERTC